MAYPSERPGASSKDVTRTGRAAGSIPSRPCGRSRRRNRRFETLPARPMAASRPRGRRAHRRSTPRTLLGWAEWKIRRCGKPNEAARQFGDARPKRHAPRNRLHLLRQQPRAAGPFPRLARSAISAGNASPPITVRRPPDLPVGPWFGAETRGLALAEAPQKSVRAKLPRQCGLRP